MRKSSVALAAFVVGGSMLSMQAQDDDGLTWIDDYSKALRIARQTHKPLFVEYRCEP